MYDVRTDRLFQKEGISMFLRWLPETFTSRLGVFAKRHRGKGWAPPLGILDKRGKKKRSGNVAFRTFAVCRRILTSRRRAGSLRLASHFERATRLLLGSRECHRWFDLPRV